MMAVTGPVPKDFDNDPNFNPVFRLKKPRNKCKG